MSVPPPPGSWVPPPVPGPGSAGLYYPASQGFVYASWGDRLVATLIDGAIAIVFWVPGFLLFGVGFATGHTGTCNDFNTGEPTTCWQPNVWPLVVGGIVVALGLLTYYLILCRKLGRTGQTWGRKIMGYKVVDQTTLQPVGAWKAFGRYFLTGVLEGNCFIGYLWPLWDDKKQRWTDKILNTIAVKA